MAWKLTGHWLESCSCKLNCRCIWGPTVPDQTWCSAAQVYTIESGSSDGVDLSGARFVVTLDLPGDFTAGVIDKGKLFFSDQLTAGQRAEIEGIFTGKKGGIWEAVAPMVGQWLPPSIVPITMNVDGGKTTVTIGRVGQVMVDPVKDANGVTAKVSNAPVLGAFEVTVMEVASAEGSEFHDPEMRAWKSLGAGGRIEFNWAA